MLLRRSSLHRNGVIDLLEFAIRNGEIDMVKFLIQQQEKWMDYFVEERDGPVRECLNAFYHNDPYFEIATNLGRIEILDFLLVRTGIELPFRLAIKQIEAETEVCTILCHFPLYPRYFRGNLHPFFTNRVTVVSRALCLWTQADGLGRERSFNYYR